MTFYNLSTPVVLIIFNRPDQTARVFKEIANAKPTKLFIIGDGPRLNREGEIEKVLEAQAIVANIDWDCEVSINFSPVNLGCKNRIASGLDWVFEREESAIILEDDCLPHPMFFRFCQELLEKYKHDERVGMIGGSNFQGGKQYGTSSYYFSRYAHIWGWATWSRAWKHYDVNASSWPEIKRRKSLTGLIKSRDERRHWEKVFTGVSQGYIDTWDYQWVLTAWSQGWLSIIPNVNLISNIGFGADATHTTRDSLLSALPSADLSFPLSHPKIFIPEWEADDKTGRDQYIYSLAKRVMRRLKTNWVKFVL